MSKMRTIALVGAVGCAVVAGLMMRNVLNHKQDAKQEVVNTVQTTDVLVAAKDILMGDKLGEGALIWKPWPKDNILPAMISRDVKPDALKDMALARARLPFFKDEAILDKKIVLPGAGGFMSAILPKGMRAISVKISAQSSAGGFILPNDRVDVILTKKHSDQKTGEVSIHSETVIMNVRVLAVNQVFKQAAEGDPVSVEKGETATLELLASQAEMLAQVESSGELALALRSIAENDGKSPQDLGPVLSEKYTKKVATGNHDPLFIRYGIEAFAGNP